MEILLVLVSCTLFLVGTVICRTLVFYKFWGWFVVPALGVEPIGFLLAMGLSFLINFFTFDPTSVKLELEPDQDYWHVLSKGVGMGIVAPLLLLLAGWIITLFM